MVEVKAPQARAQKANGPAREPVPVQAPEKAPALSTGTPFEFMRRFAEEMDRLFDDYGYGMGRGWTWPGMLGRGRELLRRETGLIPADWSPRVELIGREGMLVVRAELPGLTAKDVQVEVTGDAVLIKGERKQETEEKKPGCYYSECRYGSFFRAIPLPEGAVPGKATAHFRDGVLEVEIPAPVQVAAEEPVPRRIEVKEGR